MNRLAVCLVFLLVGIALAEEKVRYDNHQVLSCKVSDAAQGEKFLGFVEQHPELEYDIWAATQFPDATIEIRVSPHNKGFLMHLAGQLGMNCQVVIENLQSLIDAEETYNQQVRSDPNSSFFSAYQDFDQINTFLTTLNTQYPNLTTIVQIGTTIQGRPINAIKISTQNSTTAPDAKPGIVLNGCQHAREWISPMTICYLANALLYNYTSGDPTIIPLVEQFEWVLVPVVNGDGFVYTQTDRMWRKNRQTNSIKTCPGVDNNRNWNFHWNDGGSSTNPCSDSYCGPSGFSEPEETALANFITKRGNVQLYIDFHSYSQLFMNPWGYTSQLPPDDAIQKQLMQGFVAQIAKVHGKQYGYGNVYTTIYPASGGSNDWTYGGAGVVFSFAIELRPQNAAEGGFLLPASEIVPQGQEIFPAVVYAAQFAAAHPQTTEVDA